MEQYWPDDVVKDSRFEDKDKDLKSKDKDKDLKLVLRTRTRTFLEDNNTGLQ